jgi:hypothetical protein
VWIWPDVIDRCPFNMNAFAHTLPRLHFPLMMLMRVRFPFG